jgi:glycosyltransferase involved in cell wall biosynthesis
MAVESGAAARPVVLVVGFPESVHTARWLNMLLGHGIRLVLLPVYRGPLAKEIGRYRIVADADDLARCSDSELGVFDLDSVSVAELDHIREETGYVPWEPAWLRVDMTQAGHAVAAIRRLRPALVHSMVVQFGGYLTLAAREHIGDDFPAWLLSNWGSDIYLFRKVPEHREKIARIALLIDAYHAECERDIAMIRQMGFRRFTFPALPATGGSDFSEFPKLSVFPRPSQRRDIVLKGYHGWSGRALHLLSALHLAADTLRNFTIRITVAGPQIREVARTLSEADGLKIVIEPYVPNHRDALIRLGNARMVAGLGISDGISTTLLEAMSMGAFPIQGDTSCGSEWIVPGKTGFLVSPNDIAALAEAIRRAATDDELVDNAAEANRRTVEARWNAATNSRVILDHYRALLRGVGVSVADAR